MRLVSFIVCFSVHGNLLNPCTMLLSFQEARSLHRDGEDPSVSALDEDDFQTLRIENRLGCDIYVKRTEHNSDIVDQLHHGDCASVSIPPPRFSDRLNVADESREARYYIAIQILEAQVVYFLPLEILVFG